jgi:hypothetical protein
MLAFLVSLLFVAVVFSIGAGVASGISIIPFSLLERTARGARYSQLGLHDPPAPVRAAARRRTRPMRARRGLALLPSEVPAR